MRLSKMFFLPFFLLSLHIQMTEIETIMPIRLPHPGNMGLFGKSRSGKTTFISKLVKYRDMVYSLPENGKFKTGWLFYGSVWQPLYDEMAKDEDIRFSKGLPVKRFDEVVPVGDRPALIILDDLRIESSADDRLKTLVSKDSHHLGFSVVISFQSLFPGGREAVNVQRQYDFNVFFNFPGNSNLITKLAAFTEDRKDAKQLFEIWKKWTGERGGYMLIDCHPDQIEEQTIFRAHPDISKRL